MPMLAPDIRLGFADSRLRYPMLGSEKVDGFRILVIGNRLITRTWKDFRNRRLREHFADLLALSREGWVFDGECADASMDFGGLQSVLQSRDARIPETMRIHVFDALTIQEWFNRRSPRFSARAGRYADLLRTRSTGNCVAVEHRLLLGPFEAEAAFFDVVGRHGEGIVLRDPNGGYKHGRCPAASSPMYKFKQANAHDRPPAPVLAN